MQQRDKLKPILFSIIKHSSKEELKEQIPKDIVAGIVVAVVALPLSIASCPEEKLALTQAIMALPPKLREIVLLYYYQDMSLRTCANVLGISAPTATRRLQQAQKKLRIQLEERG